MDKKHPAKTDNYKIMEKWNREHSPKQGKYGTLVGMMGRDALHNGHWGGGGGEACVFR